MINFRTKGVCITSLTQRWKTLVFEIWSFWWSECWEITNLEQETIVNEGGIAMGLPGI